MNGKKSTNKNVTSTLFTEDSSIVEKIGNTTYILNVRYKKDAKEGVADKLLRLIENYEE